MAIYLIRHAQSVGNVNERAQSHASIALTEFGHQQAQQLTQSLPKADVIYISSYLRTQQTAQPLIQRDQIEPMIMNIEEFSYLSDSRCKNTTLEERKPWVDQYWNQHDIDYLDGTDAESFRDFFQRVSDFILHLEHIKSEYQTKNLMVFSHGQFLTLLKMIYVQKCHLTVELMKDFRFKMLHHPIENTEFFKFE